MKNRIESDSQHNYRVDTTTTAAKAPRLLSTRVYISMAITYPAEVIKFQIVRSDPDPELRGGGGLQRVSINIYDNNFSQIFPDRHVKFLDKLKSHKRLATEEEAPSCAKKSKVVMTRSATDPLPQDN